MTIPYDPEHITYFAETDYRNERKKFGIKSRDRTRHMYVIGKSGVGKSTLLENMAIQDIARGEGVAVLDPHGSFAEKMLDYIPMDRIKDVVYFAPFDTEHPISFNVLEDVGHDKRHLVASGLMSSFKKIWVDAWSARMEYILNNILLALLEYPDATLLGVNRMLSDKAFRNKVVENVTDPSIKSFWTDEFAKYGERYMQEAGAAIQNKIGQFTANPLVRNIIGQTKSSFDIRKIMDEQKILLINLSKGRIGEQNTSLLGSMIITKIYLSAMSRAEVTPTRLGALPNFYFYVDEFQSFANETFADILAEARKYKLALIIAHQYVAQMEEKVRDAVFGNVGTTISFRVGPLDAELLEKVFAPQFTENDLINLGMAQVYLSLMINDIGSPPFSAKTLPPMPRPAITFRNDAIEYSRANFAHPKDQVELATREWYALGADVKDEPPQKKIRFADGKAPQGDFRESFKKPFPPRQYSPSVPQDRPAQAPRREAPVQRPQDLPVQKPFQKAFQKAAPLEVVEANTETKQDAQTSVGLKALLAIDTFDKPTERASETSPVSQAPRATFDRAPFDGEKPLREVIPPAKLAERGATQESKDLLRSVLQKAGVGDVAIKKTEPPAPNPRPAPRPAETVIPPTVPETSQVPTGPSEVLPDDLKKILE